MRNPPDMTSDPYRTLGLQPGASMADVKRAYRRLAKEFHPDSAGEVALPRFLAVHAAYEHIRTGRPITVSAPVRGPWQPRPAEPWRADPERARAARERARANRPGRAGAGPTGPGAGQGRPGQTGSAQGPGSPPGASASSGPATGSKAGTAAGRAAGGATGGAGAASGTSTPGATAGAFGRARTAGGRRETRKATLGSTSYDEARDPRDATWSGASWYGPTTGEYWIINPREYADPRKHGPEYQSRARRPAGIDDIPLGEPGVEGPASAADEEQAADVAAPGAAGSPPGAGVGAGAGAGRRGWARAGASWEPTAAAPVGAPDLGAASDTGPTTSGFGAGSVRAASTTRASRSSPLGEAVMEPPWSPPVAIRRDWFSAPGDDPIRRLGLALVAWPPIGLAAAAVIGELTGCATYSAECGGSDAVLPWLAQAGILGLLLLLPPLARILAGGAVAVVLALVPVTGFLVVVGASGAPQAGFALAFLLAVIWLVGVGWATVALARRRDRAGPASTLP